MQSLQGWTPWKLHAAGMHATLSCGAYLKQDNHSSIVHADTVISWNAQPAAGKNMRSCCCCSLTRGQNQNPRVPLPCQAACNMEAATA
jgi:hypothetical protein